METQKKKSKSKKKRPVTAGQSFFIPFNEEFSGTDSYKNINFDVPRNVGLEECIHCDSGRDLEAGDGWKKCEFCKRVKFSSEI